MIFGKCTQVMHAPDTHEKPKFEKLKCMRDKQFLLMPMKALSFLNTEIPN